MMTPDRTEELWQYAAGELSSEAAAQLEADLAQDDDLRQAWLEVRRLHEELAEMEADAPSMRFAKNVVDRLPQASESTATGAWLLPRRWRVALGGLFLALTAGLIGLATLGNGSTAESGTAIDFTRVFSGLFNLSLETYLIVLASCSALLTVVLVDRLIERRRGVRSEE